MDTFELSDRLLGVAEYVTPGNRICDVGCDHGFLSIYLIKQGKVPSGLAADVNPGPLSAAKKHIEDAGLSDKLNVRLSNGLLNISENEGESLIIAGMGGPLILTILGNSPSVRDSFNEIIIGPQSKIEEVRAGLSSQELLVIDEKYIFEDGKYYPIMKLVPAVRADENQKDAPAVRRNELKKRLESICCDKSDDCAHGFEKILNAYGDVLIFKRERVFMQFLEHERCVLENVLTELDCSVHEKRIAEIKEQIRVNGLAAKMCE